MRPLPIGPVPPLPKSTTGVCDSCTLAAMQRLTQKIVVMQHGPNLPRVGTRVPEWAVKPHVRHLWKKTGFMGK